MPTLTAAARNAACDAIVDLIDAGAAAGYLEFQTAGGAEVATLTFSDPAFGDAAAGVATADTITSDTSATGGTVTQAKIYDSNDTEVLSMTVATSGSDIDITSTTIAATEQVAMSSLTITVPAS